MPRLLAPRYWGAHLLALVAVAGGGAWAAGSTTRGRSGGRRRPRDLTQHEPVPLDEAIGPDDPFPGDRVGQPVVVEGSWLPDATVLVSGREHDGRDGYWVVTPVATAAAAGRRSRSSAAGPRARTTYPRRRRGPPSWSAGCSRRRAPARPTPTPPTTCCPQLRIADLVQRVDQDLYGAYAVVADRDGGNDGTDGLEQATLEQLPDVGRFTAVRNLLYAIEWWFFGAFALFIWVALDAGRGRGRRRRPHAAGEEPRSTVGGRVKNLFNAYRVLALVVGVLLAFCSLVALPLKYLAAEGSDLQQFGESASIMWVAHGWVFMAYVVVAFLLSRKAGWTIGVHHPRPGGRPDPAAHLLGRARRHPAVPRRAPRARHDDAS